MSLDITNAFAQNEVRGVETKLVTYYDGKYEYFGYEFYNMNSIPVSVDAELYCIYKMRDETILEKTKTFVLNSKEKYIWKPSTDDDFDAMYRMYGHDPSRKKVPGDSFYTEYYVKYKAYKLE